MTIKYGFKWTKDKYGYLGVHLENKVYGISSTIQKDGTWTHEILTLQTCYLTGCVSYEVPIKDTSVFYSKDIHKVVAEVNRRVQYWKKQDFKKSKVGFKPTFNAA